MKRIVLIAGVVIALGAGPGSSVAPAASQSETVAAGAPQYGRGWSVPEWGRGWSAPKFGRGWARSQQGRGY